MINKATREVWLDSKPVRSTERTFKLLLLLAEAVMRGRPWLRLDTIREALVARITPESAIYDAIRNLRRQFDHATDPRSSQLIESQSNRGYRLALEPDEVQIQ